MCGYPSSGLDPEEGLNLVDGSAWGTGYEAFDLFFDDSIGFGYQSLGEFVSL